MVVSSRKLSFPLLSLLSLVVLPSCARHNIANQTASLSSSSSVWLRNTYDTDPSIYVGRFVPAGVTELDESNAMVLACSKHITTRFIDGGGVDYTEDMFVSTQVALKIGMPVVASGSAGYNHSRTAQARYKLTGKLVAEIADPDAFAACCKAQPDQCTDRFIGEFIQGTGSLYHDAARTLDLQGEGTNPQTGISGEGGVSRSAEWQRAAEFPNPVYFAFKINPTPYTQGAVDTCPDWVDNPPSSDGGVYVVGSVDNQRSESAARDSALRDAGNDAARATGVMVPVRAESWCVTSSKKRERSKPRYAARVLGFVSNAEIEHAREQARIAAEQEQARLEAAREQARLDAERMAAEREAAERDAANNPTPIPTDDTTPGELPDEPDETTPMDGPEPTPSAGTGDLARILTAVRAEAMSSDKLSALAFSVKGAKLTAADARKVLDEFAMGEDKLAALQTMRDVITDPQNWQVLVDSFTYSGDREAARELAP
ncbi:MAG TPA: DUF4476 domain-containing protein [Enhygromyxa sp.]|nr:DUF4476 domain-containing protein [Enhygromyxa sp.]